MRKIVILMFAVMMAATSTRAQAQSDYWKDDRLKASVIVFSGANVLEPAPIYGAALGLNCYFLRAEIEFGGSYIDPGYSFSRQHLMYFSPSFGLAHTFCDNYEVYLMSSWTNWGHTTLKDAPNNQCGHNVFDKDIFHWRIKVGTNITLWKKLFANVEVGYMFPKSEKSGYVQYDNLTVRAGIGYRF